MKMKNNNAVLRDERLATALSNLSQVWDTSNLNERQSTLLYLAMSYLQELEEDLKGEIK